MAKETGIRPPPPRLASQSISCLNQRVKTNLAASIENSGDLRCGPVLGALALAGLCLAAANPAAARHLANPLRNPAALVAATLAAHPQSAETVRFGQAGWAPVKVVRGGGWTPPAPTPQPAAAATAETVTFADPNAKPVRILRGAGSGKAPTGHGVRGTNIEKISFADPREMPVTVIRGPALAVDFGSEREAGFGLYTPARAADLDRVAFAVDGAESSHGADPGMWRADPAGPQGPMQVSRAAALDVGGGDRFDLAENRVLGRAYLARLFRRYGNWSDAVIAYNWGPAHLDAWIAGGRPAAQLPIEVERYRDRVLSDAGLAPAGTVWPLLDSRHLASLAPR